MRNATVYNNIRTTGARSARGTQGCHHGAPPKVATFFLFALLGLGIETFWTGILSTSLSLMGYSSVWYILFYGSVPFIFPYVLHYRWQIRLLIYALSIISIEFIGMYLLYVLTGTYPTEEYYKKRLFSIYGFIDLANIPEFILLGFTLEYFYRHFITPNVQNYHSQSMLV